MRKECSTEATENDQVDQTEAGYKMDLLLFLKTTVVSEKNLGEFQRNLEETLQDRLKIITNGSVDFSEQFPFFFVRPALVSIFIARFFGTVYIYIL